MSASANTFCIVKDLDNIKTTLLPESKTKQEVYQDDDWDNRWNWDTSELVYEDDTEKKHLWLSECIIALSPFTETLVIGRAKTLSIFHFTKNSDSNINAFNLVHTTTLPGLENDETLTSIILLPFVSHQKSTVNFRDWTAIVSGFSSGYFKIYSENGKVLMSYLFHDEPILDIKCRTYPVNQLLSEQMDEILVIYPTAVVQIDGFTLYQTLKLCRSRLTKSTEVDYTGQGYFNSKGNNNQTPFTFKKWTFQTSSDGQTYDCVNVCSFVKNDFDALVSHSIDGKPMTNDFANLFFTTGTNHYVGFYRAQEGTTHAIIDELSQFLMNRFKNVFSFFNQQKELDAKEKIKPSTNVPPDLSLFDERLGLKICLSPNRRLAAVTDDFGRVILFDMQNLIAIRIWKGYRKAEVGWIVVEDDNVVQENRKQAHFLVIYVPKRGIIEIWCAQNGPRIAAFNVGKHCKLLYLDHTMFGLNYLILQSIKQSMNHQEYYQYFDHSRCFLLNYETGVIFNFNIPFLCSLTDSKKTRDFHILKDLKNLLKKENSFENKEKFYEDVIKLIFMVKTAEVRRECVELIQTSNDPNFILYCSEKLIIELLQSRDRNELDFENKLISQMCARIIQLCHLYLNITEKIEILQVKFMNLIQESENPPDIQQLIEKLEGWSANDVVRILSLLAFRQSVLKSHQDVDQSINLNLSISEMLSHFTLYYNHLVKHNQEELYEKLPVEIMLMKEGETIGDKTIPNYDSNQFVNLDKLSCLLFWATFCGDETNLENLLNNVCILPSNLLLMLFIAWLNSQCSIYWPCWQSFSKAFIKIVNTINESESHMDESNSYQMIFNFSSLDDHLSPSWTDIITLIYKSTNITSAFIAINMIKALIHKVKVEKKVLEKKEKEMNSLSLMNEENVSTHSLISADNEWETLHLDKENLNLLAKQLEDLFLLDLLLKSCLSFEGNFHRSSNISANNIENISLSFILTSGPGIVSEIVARWAIYHKIKPDLLVCSPITDVNDSNRESNGSTDKDRIKSDIESASCALNEMSTLSTRSTLIEILDHVRRCFPNCLDSDILLINCFWEILSQWNSQPLLNTGELSKSLDYLEQVSSSVLKHNVASMGWRLFIQKRFEILCNLIEKMGKKPKTRIIRKELEMDENNLERFANFCCDLLDFMIRTSASSETEALPLYTVDNWWHGFNSSSPYNFQYSDEFVRYNLHGYDQQTIQRSKHRQSLLTTTESPYSMNIPLAIMAMHQKMPNIDLLIENYHLAQSVQLIVIFSIRNVRPLSLFSSSVRAYFFKDLFSFLTFDSKDHSFTLLSDPVLSETRMKFLEHAITGIVQTIPAYQNDNEKDTCQQFYITANKWFNKVIQLAREWKLDVDRIRLHYVHDLFLYGCDPLAEELMSTVSNTRSLGRQLLIIAGMRLSHILNSKYSSLDEVSFLAPNVLFWLKSLVTNPNCNTDVPRSSTILLLERVSNILYDSETSNYRICEELLSAFKRYI